MKRIIKKVFNLYDEADLNNKYIEGYELGKRVGEEEALFKKYTPNEIRKLLELDPIESKGE